MSSSDLDALRRYRDHPSFGDWAGDVPEARIEAATGAIRGLIDEVIALGGEPAEDDVRAAVGGCVRRFNALDDEGWITTIEREDIAEAIWKVIDLAGFEGDEDWIEDREW